MAVNPRFGYPYSTLTPNRNKSKSVSDTLICVWHYKFLTKNGVRYNVDIEQHTHDLFILKFHQDKHRRRKDKYRILTGEYDAYRVFSTILNITIDVYEKFPMASFGFVGARSLDEKSREKTKRWKLYSRIMVDYFSPSQFHHASMPEKSLFVALNSQKEKQVPKLWEQIIEQLELEYEEDDDSLESLAFSRSCL